MENNHAITSTGRITTGLNHQAGLPIDLLILHVISEVGTTRVLEVATTQAHEGHHHTDVRATISGRAHHHRNRVTWAEVIQTTLPNENGTIPKTVDTQIDHIKRTKNTKCLNVANRVTIDSNHNAIVVHLMDNDIKTTHTDQVAHLGQVIREVGADDCLNLLNI